MGELLSVVSEGVEWSYGVKLILIIAAAALLCSAVVLFAAEIIGKRKRRIIYETAAPAVVVEPPAVLPAEDSEAVEETAAAEPCPENEIEISENTEIVDEGEDRGVVVFGEYRFAVRYNRSFTAKLIQSDEVLKGRYSELKNQLMRYMKPRMSWFGEAFYSGRTTYAKFAVRGKTLSLYLALEPAEYAGTKYKFEDAGEVAKYAGTPMRLKLRSERSVRWAKELIAQLADKRGLAYTDRADCDFRPGFEETAALVHKKLIKLNYSGEQSILQQDGQWEQGEKDGK